MVKLVVRDKVNGMVSVIAKVRVLTFYLSVSLRRRAPISQVAARVRGAIARHASCRAYRVIMG